VATAPLPKRPYLLRALHQWITDSGHTPHLVVAADRPEVKVPVQFVEEGRITLNISYSATSHLDLGNDAVVFDARFSGTPHRVYVPLNAVLGIYARETGEGLVFPTDEYGGDAAPAPDDPPPAIPPAPTGRPSLKVVK
jgi:stringent starvation protein B